MSLEQLKRFIDQNPGASVSVRKRRTDYSVRIAAPNTADRATSATNEDLEKAIDAAMVAYEANESPDEVGR